MQIGCWTKHGIWGRWGLRVMRSARWSLDNCVYLYALIWQVANTAASYCI